MMKFAVVLASLGCASASLVNDEASSPSFKEPCTETGLPGCLAGQNADLPSSLSGAADVYHSRLEGGEGEIAARVDPCLWGKAEGGPLSQDQLDHYEKYGYVVVKQLFSPSEMIGPIQDKDDLAEFYLNKSAGTSQQEVRVTDESPIVSEPGSSRLKSFFCPHLKAPENLKSLANAPPLFRIAKQLLDDDVYIHQSRLNFQQAHIGQGFQWHSDFETWHCEDGMPKPRATSAVVMLATNRPFNGALMVFPGSHKHYVRVPGKQPNRNWENSLQTQTYGSPKGKPLVELAEASCGSAEGEPIVHIVGDPGDVVFFDSNLMHGSHTNISPFPRENLFQVFNAHSNALVEPFSGTAHRPEHIAHRKKILSSTNILSEA